MEGKIRFLAGILYLGMLFGVICHAYISSFPLMISVVAGWLGSILLLPLISSTAEKQTIILYAIAAILSAVAVNLGGTLEPFKMFSSNVTMAAMFASGSFLSLLTRNMHGSATQKGEKGILSTFLSSNLLGAVISLAVIYLIGDRLEKKQKLTYSQVMVISRGFGAASYWSPFFVGGAVALSYAPEMKLAITIPMGIILVIATMLITFLEIKNKEEGEFEGYPISISALKLPFLLVVGVLVYHVMDSTMNIIVVISIVTPIISMLLMNKVNFKNDIYHLVADHFPSMGGQIALYLAAGLLSGAIAALLKVCPPVFLYNLTTTFGPNEAIVALAIIILISYLGLHPIITISSLFPIINHFNPSPTLVGLVMVIGWGMGITVSPLSATNLSLLGRYGTTAKEILKMNKLFTIEMLIICYGLFWLCTKFIK